MLLGLDAGGADLLSAISAIPVPELIASAECPRVINNEGIANSRRA